MSLFVAKMVFFSLSGSEKLTGESVRGCVIRTNMRLAYTAHQAADPLSSRELEQHAIDRLFEFLPLYCSVLPSVTALDDKQQMLNHGAWPQLGKRLSSGSCPGDRPACTLLLFYLQMT